MNKLVKDGLVAVLYSPGFGAGWSTWNPGVPEILFDPAIVELVEKRKRDELKVYVTLKYLDLYMGGLEDLTVAWLPEGSEFRIHDNDGSESIEIKHHLNWIVA